MCFSKGFSYVFLARRSLLLLSLAFSEGRVVTCLCVFMLSCFLAKCVRYLANCC